MQQAHTILQILICNPQTDLPTEEPTAQYAFETLVLNVFAIRTNYRS